MAYFVSPNQIQIQIGLVLLVRHDTSYDTSQPCIMYTHMSVSAYFMEEENGVKLISTGCLL